ncbi:E3 ubiquitin-protein ligase rnf213-beta isoform X2 [Colossoma macropomum]|uniref:E3 ubiquitin-protein ligase rnf213-beta isoform X2 n=1 Tax=Colossoma macropomum TaxID=42526 RepID=UPI001864CE47|nr:E3 ubiquitin-protein ligase rnf213-beta isoform X2 [Colossoma macropomum]
MKRKRHNKGRKKGADKAGGNNDSLKESGRKTKTKRSETGSSTSNPAQKQPEDTSTRPRDQAEHQESDQGCNRAVPETGKAEAQTQTIRLEVRDEVTQTEPVNQNSRHTQTDLAWQPTQLEPAEDTMEWEPTQLDRGNAENEKNEGKGTKGSMKESRSPDEKRGESALSGENVPHRDAEKEKKSNKNKTVGRSGEDPQNSSDQSSADSGPKSYAAAASATEHIKDSKERSVQTAVGQEGRTHSKGEQRKTSPVRAPTVQPAFTFYVYIVVDKKFRFNRDEDKLLLCHAGGSAELEITHFKGLREKGYLIEAKFSVDESILQRGSVMSYRYAVMQRQKVIEEIATRSHQIPIYHSIKEMHLFEAHMSLRGSFKDWLRSWIKSADRVISEAWENSAHFLLDRLFEKWDPSSQESVRTFTQLLNSYMSGFQAARERVYYYDNVPTPFVKVSELIAKKLVKLLNGEGGGRTSEGSADVSPLTLGLSVFQVCCACHIELGIKDWGKICQLVSSGPALGQVEEIQNASPALQHTVLGLMNRCARSLVSELVLLVPLLHTLRQPGADSGRLGPTVEETDWTGLHYVEFRSFREKIRRHPDKRRMMLQMVQDHKSLVKEKPRILTSWLSMMAFEDITEFAKLTDIVPEYLIQSLMYRLKEFELCIHNTASISSQNLQITEEILRCVMKWNEQDLKRITASKRLDAVLECCRSVHRSACRIARQDIQMFKAAVLSFQLVLKLAEIQYEVLSKNGEEKDQEKKRLFSQLEQMQKEFSQWRDGLLRKPLLHQSTLSYPNEIELWDAFFGLESSIERVTEQWLHSLETDLRKRITELTDVRKIQVCCVESSAKAIAKSHRAVQTCFQDVCLSAIKSICQAGKEGDLLQTLLSDPKSLHSSILSSIVVESAARFGEDTVTQLLDAQSAVHILLSQGDWNQWKIEEDACHVMQKCQSILGSLVISLCQGNIPLSHLRTVLKNQNNFQKMYKNCMKHGKLDNIPIDAEELLAQREKDLLALKEQREHMDVLIKMIGKISEMIHVPEISLLEDKHKIDLQALSLNELLAVQPCFSKEDLREISTGRVLYYNADLLVLDTARQMHEFRESNLLLSSWVDRATALASMNTGSGPVSLKLTQVISEIWQPSVCNFNKLGIRIAQGLATFEEVDKVVDGCGDEGDGTKIKKELHLMATELESYQGLEKNWPRLRFIQIQEYRQLHHAAEAASAILRIRDRLGLRGDFSPIYSLTELRDDSFKQKTLKSLSNDLISAKERLSDVKHQHTACLEAFLESEKLIRWVKTCIENLSELKFFMNLAGESDADIDRLASFRDAVAGYSPFLYSLPLEAGFKEFIACAQQIWDNLQKDEKLTEKLKDSCRWLDWLKSVRDTHGSVEQSSLSLASAINTSGVYHVEWPADSSEKKCLGSVLYVKVPNNEKDKTYSLDELLELQNKLMLMSSKGECGKEQVVNKFTEIFEGAQRMGHILLQLWSSGNIFFRDLEALVKCNPEEDPCISIHCPLLGKHVVYHGHVAEQLQKVCRSMEACHEDWRNFMSDMRSRFYALNHYTSEQVVYLCNWIHNICVKRKPVPQQIWHLLHPLKPSCTLNDIREAFEKATESIDLHLQCQLKRPTLKLVEDSSETVYSMDIGETRPYDEKELPDRLEEDKTSEQCCGTSTLQPDLEELDVEVEEEEEEILDKWNQDEETFSYEPESREEMNEPEAHSSTPVQWSKTEKTAMESLDSLWGHFRNDMLRYLTQYVDIETLAHFLSSLSAMNQVHIKRKLPSIFQEGRPNLVHCPSTELISTTLSFYMESPEQTFPSVDEVLMCKEDTTEEEVEIFLRRCLGRGAPSGHQKIYTVVNPGLLTYDVSVALAELFEAMEKSARSQYRIAMVCPVNQDRYVPSFFSNYKVQGGLSLSAERAKEYLRCHLTVPFRHSSHFQVYPDDLSAWMITSKRPAVGKSLYITRMYEHFKNKVAAASYLPIRLIEPSVDTDCFVQTLSEKLRELREQDPVLLHIDAAAVRCGLEEFLFKLLVLGCLSDSKGTLWRRNTAHLIAVEALLPDPAHHRQTLKESNQGLLHLLPTIHCRPPKEVEELELRNSNQKHACLDPLMDIQEFQSEGIQRPYQYLRRFNRNESLDSFTYQAKSVEGNPADCLHHLLSNCGLKDPSWAELKHFTWFLNLQLKDCESSGFCDPYFFADLLRGFKTFIVKFMIHMARDFASPSLDISDQSPSLHQGHEPEDDLLARLTVRKRWENQSHPYIFFNADHLTMTFLGFHVKQVGHLLNAVDPQNGRVLMGNVMSPELFFGLQQQRISFSEDFDQLPRANKLKKISLVVGAKEQFDPDPTYELTADNVMKMLAIHMRFRCEIPVIIMGETGCGKTRLVKFLCDMQREGKHVENMKLVKVHGGTTAETIYKKVREAERLAERNSREYKLDTILFFDEANTTEAIFAIKEVLCDKSVQGFPLKKNSGLKIIAACNPYRRHTPEMIERLERAGLGYRVKAGETEDRLGKVPMRQLVYRVHPLPPSMIPLVWDFGQLSDSTELSYIRQIVQKQMEEHRLPLECKTVITNVLAASQSYMRRRKDECSFVSLRDVERSMTVLVWFYQHRQYLFPSVQRTDIVHMTLKCLALALGVCYYPSLECRGAYLSAISKHFPQPLNSDKALEHEISSCQDFFLENIPMRETIAKNSALKENVFLMVVCIELRIPLFLVGKPGSSKSLAKTVVADAMQRQASLCDLFRRLKEVHMVSFQCSPHSSPDGIIATFRNCARFQKDKNMDEYVSVVVLDEIGLAEDSPQMPLKTLHPLLEDGCIDNERPDPHMKVGFVGISNWALDPAKMNRGIFVSRWDPSEKELVETANGICSSSKSVLLKIKHLLPKLATGFLSICKNDSDQFFGLRDYYSLVKMIFATVKNTDSEPSDSDLAEAVLRNFSGQKNDFDPLRHFQDLFLNLHEVPRTSTLKMIEQNLEHSSENECRYLLLLTTNNAALYIVQQYIFSKGNYACPEIVFGSGFPKDQEYAQICRNVSRVKSCMETGRTVILLNLLNLYESLYDALNQYYVEFCGQRYVDLGLGSHRVKCRVHRDFRLVVIEDQEKVYDKFPVPLKNRLEKHRVDRSTDLTPWQHRVLAKLRNWVCAFSHAGSTSSDFSPTDAFVGFHGDACASALLQALEKREKQDLQKVGNDHVSTDTSTVKEGNVITAPIEEGSITMITENQAQGGKAVGHQMTPSDDKESAIIGVESDVDHTVLADDEEGLALMRVDDSDEAIEVEKEAEVTDAIPKSEEMDIDPGEPEAVKYNEPNDTKDEEEEVYESAKYFLLKCATPDSVLRLKYSKLGNQEAEKHQLLYFHQQHHHSLKDFMNSHLKKNDKEKSRFIEVTTFAGLLTKADVRNLTQALGLSMEQLLLLSLHQFDTEASFCRKIRNFLQRPSLSIHILLVQTDMEESLCKNELIASAKYCTMNELLSFRSEDYNCYVVFITKLSRIASGNKYIGFQGGAWLSVHIDDLRDTDDMSLDLSVFCGTPISKLLSQPRQSDVKDIIEDQEGAIPEGQREEPAYLHSLSLVKSCSQKAVSLLRDPVNKASRSMTRMGILLDLLGNNPGNTAARFQKVLLKRLVVALTQREELIHNSGDWVNKEAMKREALQEGGTLRHTLWRCLQGVLTPVLARVLEILDRDSNLDLLYDAGLSEGLIQFWLDIFSDEQILDLSLPQGSSGSEQEIDVQCSLLVGVDEHACTAPFSWLIRLYCHNLWEESQFVQGTGQSSKERIQQFVSAVTGSSLGSYVEKLSERERVELGHKYLTDFVLLSFKIKTEEEMKVFVAAMLGCVSALQQSMSVTPDFSPAWIMAAAHHYSPRLDALSHALQLQPHLAPLILKQQLQKDLPDMFEDILALGICVEETKLQSMTSIPECMSFLSRVELLQPCLQRVMSHSYCSLCSPGCLKHLTAIKSVWQGMQVMAAFIEQVVVKVNSKDERLVALTMKHCSQLQRLMEECPDLQSKAALQQLIRILNDYHEESISRELRFGIKCPVCLLDMSEPCVLQCEHVFCLSCVKSSLAAKETKYCPKCRTDLPPNYQPTVSSSIKFALKEHRNVRRCCNSFFLEVVSRFCLSEGQRPEEDMVELLFSLLISAQGDVYKTRELTPFLECVDQSPVVRSVLPKLLLQYSFDQVMGHIQAYLENLEDKLLDDEDRTELYRLFANCFQDSLLCPSLGRALESGELRHQQEDINFLSRLVRKQTPSRERQPAEFLLSMARLRISLDTAARILPRAVGQKSGGCAVWEQKLLEQVKAVCEYGGNDWYRVYLLRVLNRQAGIDCVQTLMNSAPYEWVFPAELLRLQRLIPAEVDRFLCCGQLYQLLRNGVGQVLLESSTDELKTNLQDVVSSSSARALLALALFRRVTCRLFSPDSAMHPGAQELEILKDFIRKNTTGHLRELCTSLLSNQAEGLVSQLYISAGESAERRHLMELVVHANAVFHSGSSLLHPLHLIASRPQTMTEAFLPTMPDDNTSTVRQWLTEKNLKMYLCSNGHPCLVGECGKPTALAKCDTCGVQIGGQHHNPVPGFTLVHNVSDQTRRGHVLGEAARRSEAPNRDLTMAQSSVLRLCLHLAMLQGSAFNLQGISAMIQPTVYNVSEFLWHHLEKDMESLGKTLNLNWEDTAIAVHLILNAFAHLSTAGAHQGAAQLSSRQAREQWEKEICKMAINPILMDLDRQLSDAQERIAADDKLSDSTLIKVLKGDPCSLLSLPSDCPSHHSAFWTPPDPLTVERLSQLISQKQAVSPVPLLSLFVNRVQCVRQLVCLPDLAALLSDLMRVVPAHSEMVNHTIATQLHSLPAGHQRNTLTQRVKTFCHVWNQLRMELFDKGVDSELCGKDVTMESSGQYLSLNRRGPGSCLYALIDLLSETHNSLVREARKLSHQEDSDYSVPLGALSESQLALCHPEKELLPLVLAHCNYTLVKGQQTATDYDLQAVERQLNRRFLAGKPRIQTDTEKYLKRHHQDFSEVLKDVRTKISQEPLKGSMCSSIRAVLRSFTDVCNAVYALEIGLRFLGKTGGRPDSSLLSYLQKSLRMEQDISSNVAKALAENRLDQSTATWQLLTCWRSELKQRKGQDPFPRLSKEFKEKLTVDERRELKEFLEVTDVDLFTLELHEILLLKTDSTSQSGYSSNWDIQNTMESHLDEKGAPVLPGLDCLSSEITLSKAAEVWRLAVEFKT